jgi:hypothetical protein
MLKPSRSQNASSGPAVKLDIASVKKTSLMTVVGENFDAENLAPYVQHENPNRYMYMLLSPEKNHNPG